MQPPDTDGPVTILGAGIVGICTALSLLERGIAVTVIDRTEPGQETSYGNAGVVSPFSCIPQSMPGIWKKIPQMMLAHGRPLSIHPKFALKMLPWGLRFLAQSREDRALQAAEAMSTLCAPSIDLYERHLRGTGHEALLQDSIYIQAFRDGSKATLTGLDARIRAEKGAEMEVVGRDRLSQLEPALGPAFKAAVLVKGTGRVRSPGRVGAVLAEKARALGATFITADIQRIRRSDTGWTIHCTGQDHHAERIVICLGAWSLDVLDGISLRIPLISERGYHVEFPDPGVELNNSVMDVDGKYIASSMEGGLRAAGHADFAPPDAPPSKRRQNALAKAAKAAMPDLNTENMRFWMGCRPSFPDSLPALGPVTGQPGLFANFGHSHYGLMMAPKSGELLASTLCGERVNIDQSPYSIDRF